MGAQRADAARNRARILAAAQTLFAEEGLSASVQELARRSGVSTGTVSRHFPTKEDLFEALLRHGMGQLVNASQRARLDAEPGSCFFPFCEALIVAGTADRGLADRLRGATSPERQRHLSPAVQALCDELDLTLHQAQAAGRVRTDIGLEDVEVLLDACMRSSAPAGVMIDVIRRGLSPEEPTRR